jgi:Kef-type K+ transport system membrane component KefB
MPLILLRQTFNTKDDEESKKSIIGTALKLLVWICGACLVIKVLMDVYIGKEVKREIFVIPVVLLTVIFCMNTSLPYKINVT